MVKPIKVARFLQDRLKIRSNTEESVDTRPLVLVIAGARAAVSRQIQL